MNHEIYGNHPISTVPAVEVFTEYTIVSSQSADSVIRDVRDLLGKGWKLAGGLATSTREKSASIQTLYSQALTRERIR